MAPASVLQVQKRVRPRIASNTLNSLGLALKKAVATPLDNSRQQRCVILTGISECDLSEFGCHTACSFASEHNMSLVGYFASEHSSSCQ
jgi:hypothetical protein